MWNSIIIFFSYLFSCLTYGYLLRVPLLCMIILICLCFGANTSLLGNLFDVNQPWQMFFLSFTAFSCAWTIMISWRTTLIYGWERFGLDSQIVDTNVKWRHILFASLIVLPLNLVSLFYPFYPFNSADSRFEWKKLAEAVLGFVGALAVLAIAEILHKWS